MSVEAIVEELNDLIATGIESSRRLVDKIYLNPNQNSEQAYRDLLAVSESMVTADALRALFAYDDPAPADTKAREAAANNASNFSKGQPGFHRLRKRFLTPFAEAIWLNQQQHPSNDLALERISYQASYTVEQQKVVRADYVHQIKALRDGAHEVRDTAEYYADRSPNSLELAGAAAVRSFHSRPVRENQAIIETVIQLPWLEAGETHRYTEMIRVDAKNPMVTFVYRKPLEPVGECTIDILFDKPPSFVWHSVTASEHQIPTDAVGATGEVHLRPATVTRGGPGSYRYTWRRVHRGELCALSWRW